MVIVVHKDRQGYMGEQALLGGMGEKRYEVEAWKLVRMS